MAKSTYLHRFPYFYHMHCQEKMTKSKSSINDNYHMYAYISYKFTKIAHTNSNQYGLGLKIIVGCRELVTWPI